MEYGNAQVDLTKLRALVDPYQVFAIGYALLLAGNTCQDRLLSPADLAGTLCRMIEEDGLAVLSQSENDCNFFACPRRLEMAGVINRWRGLQVAFED